MGSADADLDSEPDIFTSKSAANENRNERTDFRKMESW